MLTATQLVQVHPYQHVLKTPDETPIAAATPTQEPPDIPLAKVNIISAHGVKYKITAAPINDMIVIHSIAASISNIIIYPTVLSV